MKKNFIIMTEGATASHWVSANLSRINNVFCSHGYTNPPVVYPEGYSLEFEAKKRKNDQGKVKNIEEYYKIINKIRNEEYCGTIHLYNYSDISEFSKNKNNINEIKKYFKLISIVRHPVLRIQSFYEHFLKICKIDNLMTKDINVWVENEVSLTGITQYMKKNFPSLDLDDFKVKAFLCAIGITNSASGNLYQSTKKNIKFYKYEELTSNKEIQKNFISYLFDDHIKFDENIFSSNNTNSHRIKNLSQSECYYAWETWKKDAFCYSLQGYEEFYKNTCKYDLSFINFNSKKKINFFYKILAKLKK